MKLKIYLLLMLAVMGCMQAEDTTPPKTPSSLETIPTPKSFSYFRMGGFVSYTGQPFFWHAYSWNESSGGEFALGRRFRSSRFGWGPNFNIALSRASLPSILLNFEILYYPKCWNNGYWGLMPGIGVRRDLYCPTCRYEPLSKAIHQILNVIFSSNTPYEKERHRCRYKSSWEYWGGLELIIGKEYCKKNRKRFHQLSLGIGYVGYNHGWAF